MPDPRSVMKEYRFLDQKRLAEGLTPNEEARLNELRDLVGADPATGSGRAGFDVGAAAARLRESLLPAGLRNRPPPAPEPAPEPFAEIEPEPAPAAPAVEEPFAEQPADVTSPEADPAAEALFDPASLGQDAAWNPNAAAWDPNAAAYDPNTAAYDPNAAAYDPNAAAYDPNAAAYDPNAAAYDPNAAAYDPNAAAYDPNAAAYDPNAAAYDPNAAAYDPNAAAYDPNAAAYDPNAAAYDPNAAAYDPNAAAYDLNAAAYDPNAAAYDPSAAAYDPNAAAYDPSASAYGEPLAPNEGGLSEGPGLEGFGVEEHPSHPASGVDPTSAGATHGEWAAAEDGEDTAAWSLSEDAGDSPWDAIPAADPQAGFLAPPQPASTLSELGSSEETVDSGLDVPPGSGAADDSDWSGVTEALDDGGAGSPAGAAFALGDEATFDAEPAPLDDGSGVPAPLPGEGEEPAWAPVPGGEYDAAAWDAGAAPSALEPAVPFEASRPAVADAQLDAYPPEGWNAAELHDAPTEPTGFGDYDAMAPLPAAAGELETLLPFDPAAASVVGTDALDAVAPSGAEAFDEAHTPGDPVSSAGFHAAPVLLEDEAPGWQPDPGAVDHGFQLESGGSFDAAADAAAPEWAAPPAEPMPWDAGAVDGGQPLDAPPSAAGGEPALGAVGGDLGDLYRGGDLAAPDPFGELTPGGPVELDHSQPDLTADGSADADLAWAVPGGDLSSEAPDTSPAAEPAPAEVAPAFDLGGADLFGELPAPGIFAAGALAGSDPDVADAIPSPTAGASEDATAEEPDQFVEELEPLDADALEELPVEALDPEPGPVAPAYGVPGAHRVVVHTLEGQVKRGVITDVDLAAPALHLAPQTGGAAEAVLTDHVKAIFFMLAAGEHAPAAEGKRVRVTFQDGRQVAGFSPDYREDTLGFFMIPADGRTSTSRIWVYRAAVRQVAVS